MENRRRKSAKKEEDKGHQERLGIPEEDHSEEEVQESAEMPEPEDPAAEEFLLNIETIRQRAKLYKEERTLADRGVGNQKPPKDVFFMVHKDPEFHLEDVPGLRIRGDRKKAVYLFSDEVKPLVEDDFQLFDLYYCISVDGDSFYWPVLSANNGARELDSWSRSAHRAASAARTKWVRLVPKETEYLCKEAEGDLREPQWLELEPGEAFRKAFKDYLITDPDHHVIKRLRGILA
jgi:hypothetical protein